MTDRESLHGVLERVANAYGADSELSNGVSLHRMPQSVSFAQLEEFLEALPDDRGNIFVGTVDERLVVSLSFGAAKPKPSPSSNGKRKRDVVEEEAERAVNRVRKGLAEDSDISSEMLAEAERAAVALQRIRGSQGETVVESWGLNAKPMENGATQRRPRLIIAARLAAGVAVSVTALKRALGLCFKDGMVSTADVKSFAQGFQLPLSEAGAVAERAGQRSATLFATVRV